MMVIDFLRKIPFDLGQREMRGKTMGKLIALDLVHDGKGKRALDVGCREGTQTRWLEQKGYEVTSIDIEKAFDRCLVVDVNKPLPFPHASFDLIWCSEVIEHLSDPASTIREFRRILRPRGEMIVTTPNSYSWIFLFGMLAKSLQRKDHTQFWSEKSIRAIFPTGQIFGYFPYFGKLRYRIERGIGLLSPTFVIHETRN